MPLKLHFLGWDGPVVDKVTDYLIGNRQGPEPIDFHDTLIIVPTLQSGRRLREVMALRCTERKSVMLSAMIVTPNHFISTGISGPDTANPSASKIIWSKVLASADLAIYQHLFPGKSIRSETDRFMWSLNTGQIIDTLRQELADGGYTITDVLEKHSEELEELERWHDLSKLEKLYLDELASLNLKDVCMTKIRLADSPEIDAAIRRIVVACVPDPSLLAIRSLEKIAKQVTVDILVHAPEKEINNFDSWGRPIPEKWVKMNVEIPGWTENVYVEADPSAQSIRVRTTIENATVFGPLDITIGVPDTSVIPFLKKDLLSLNMPAFDPSNIPFDTHTLGRLIAYMFNLQQLPIYESTANLLRHPAFLSYLKEKHELSSRELLSQMDRFQNFYLPHSFERMLDPFEKNPKGTHDPHDDFTILGKALLVVKDFLEMFQKEKFEQAWRFFLKEIYATHEIDKSKVHDRDFENAAAIVEETLRELRYTPESIVSLTGKQIAAVFMRRLNEQNFHRERTDEIVDLQGWLELPWSDAPFMLITGMNENLVPGGSLSDAFLPDSLRVKLNLRHDLARFGRDIYLMCSMIEARKKKGRICFISGKTGMTGDPLKPSRLMFRCKDEELPGRTELFFTERHDEKPRPGSEVLFKLNPSAARDREMPDKRRINVTTFKDYLECPFRFYLKRVLKMEESSDEKTGMDAMDFGNIIHFVLERMGKEDKLWACPSPDELSTSLEQLARQYATTRYGSPLPLAVHVSLESAIQRLSAFACRQVTLTREGWRIITVEHRISAFPYHRGFQITGKIDRIDKNENTGKIRIIDYKTSDSADEPASAHTGTRKPDAPEYNSVSITGKRNTSQKKWNNLQLPLYHLLYTGKEEFDPNIELAYFNLPKAISDTGLSIWNNFDTETMSSAIRCIKGVIEDIDGCKFWPPAARVKYDPFERLFIHEPEDNFESDLKVK
ncbi:MAG: hypothetical protein A2283_23865 [Lentisphaerae bacterium RIFOXYA12_FULL_48_11]|nr:MAG: hypothetical protein A2283_23865 [Lentisphaerae bacterium RIFOXYA12_FULL_48_11]